MRRGMLPQTPSTVPLVSSVLGRVSHPLFFLHFMIFICSTGGGVGRHSSQSDGLQRRLGEVEDQREALEDGALTIFRVVKPRASMRVDQLHALSDIIRLAVRLGIRRGAAAVLASVQLRTGMHLRGIDPGFPETSSAAVHQTTMLNFAGFGRVVAAEMDVDDLLQRGADSGQDSP